MEVDESNPNEPKGFIKPSYVLIAVDTHQSMFESDGAPSAFTNCMNALYRLSDNLLLKSDRGGWSPFSVVLYDEDQKTNFVNFKDNMIDTNKLLKQTSSLTGVQQKDKYMRSCDVDLAAFFQLCKKKFKDISTTFYKRTMVFITNDNDPVNSDAAKRFTAFTEAKNFEENDITFQLVVTKEDFNYSIFYDEFSSLLKQSKVDIICEDEEGLFEMLSSTIWFRHSQRKMLFYPFADDTSKHIRVFVKSYIKPIRLLNTDYVADDGTPVKKIALNSDAQNNVSESEEFVLVDKKNKKRFEQLKFDLGDKVDAGAWTKFPMGFTLLYVCHRLSGLGEVISAPRILEADVKDELPFFKEFWQYCVNNDKVLVCAKKTRTGEKPRAVELIPKVINGNKVFLIKQIAFANEIFEPQIQPNIKSSNPTPEQIEVTDSLIDQLILEFSSSFLINKQYKKKEHYIKSKLLDEPRTEFDLRDFVTSEQIDEKIEPVLEKYLACFPPEQGTKRKKKK